MSDPAPLSKTAKYKKITKPLLERKRRARINRCLDELKDLMVGALEIDDDNLSKLEKADILELTVNHLTKLHSPKDPVVEAKKFQAGFGHCAAEACRFIMSVPDLDANVSQNLVNHLSRLITSQPLTIQVPDRANFSPPASPSYVISDRPQYYSDHERSSSDAEDSLYSGDGGSKTWYNRPSPIVQKTSSGLLTTVDKLVGTNGTEQPNAPVNAQRNAYFNRVPPDAKDIILQKIRQHIMDKRGNENYDANVRPELTEAKYLHRNDAYKSEFPYQYSLADIPLNSDTLDLRKVRSPMKSAEPHSPKKPVPYQAMPSSQPKVPSPPPSDIKEMTPSLSEQCEFPMDYSNLPPKKKRKLIEYQEYKKQEAAKRQREGLYGEKKDRQEDRPPADEDANKWRPW